MADTETGNYNNYEQEESRKRPLDDQSNDRDRKRTNGGSQPLLKLLVPNYAAGALIGKGGSNIAELQSKFGGTLRLSSNREYYPGTDERVVVILGEISQITDFNLHIMEKVQSVQVNPSDPERPMKDDGRPQQVKIVLTNGAAGLLIGRGGATIKAIQEESKAKITISNREDSPVPGERLLKISGSIDQRLEACRQVIEKIAADAGNMSNSSTKYTNTGGSIAGKLGGNMGGNLGGNLGGLNNFQQNNIFSALSNNPMSVQRGGGMAGFGIGGLPHQSLGGLPTQALGGLSAQGMGGMPNQGMGGMSNQGMGGMSNQNTKSKLKTTVQILVEIPDILVGAILGKQGQTISEFIQFSGAKIQFSGKNEFAPGTTDRILTITGDMNQTKTAYFLINQKVEQAQNELGNHR